MNFYNLSSFDFNSLTEDEILTEISNAISIDLMVKILENEEKNKSADKLENYLILPPNIEIININNNIINIKKNQIIKIQKMDEKIIELKQKNFLYYLFLNPYSTFLTINKKLGLNKINTIKEQVNQLSNKEKNTLNYLIDLGGVSSKTIAGYIYPTLKNIKPDLFTSIGYPYDNADFKRIIDMQKNAEISDEEIILKMLEIAKKENIPEYEKLAKKYIEIKNLILNNQLTQSYDLIKDCIANNIKKPGFN